MRLVADRFAVEDDGRAFDLSTGARVTLIVGSAGGVSEQLRWTARCDALYALRHHAMAPLLDYGLVADCSRFEAWGCDGGSVAREGSNAVRVRATTWLRACRLSIGGDEVDRIHVGAAGDQLWVPDSGTGYPTDLDEPGETMAVGLRGLQILEQPAVATLAEMFHAGGARPRTSVLWGAAGSGRRIIAGKLARIARSRGFVPVAASLIGSRHADLWSGRSLFVLADAGDERVWQAFIGAAMIDPRPHVLLLVGEQECRSLDGVGIPRASTEALVSAIRPQALDGRLLRTVRAAAERAHGLPGRFVRLVWPAWDAGQRSPCTSRRAAVPRVAEQQVVYGARERIDDVFEEAPAASAWPAPGELAAWRRKMAGAKAQLARGRHAPGIRQLRQAVGGLSRRGAWSEAADGSRELVRVLLRRGQPREALAAIADARDYAARADEQGTQIDLAIASGHAWIDLGRVDEAESVLGTTLAAARALQDAERLAAASLASARASYWRGDYADAEAMLASAPCVPALQTDRTLLASRIAAAAGDLGRAMSFLATASGTTAAADQETRALVAWVSGLVHFIAGDLSVAERDLSQALAFARAAHDPQRIVRARLLRIEIARIADGPTFALAQLVRLRRVMNKAPAVVRARWNLASALSASGADAAALVARHVQGTGLRPLALYVATSSSRTAASKAGVPDRQQVDDGTADRAVRANVVGTPFVDEVVAILRACQTAADEGELLKDVCARLRHHLHAAAVTCATVRGGSVHAFASEGARMESDIAERAVAAGVTISPHRLDDRIEAAAPITYGGEAIGALCARWTIGSMYDTSRAAAVLTMSAAAAAPILAAVIARQSVADAVSSELIGIAPAMTTLRQSVARAASAPFGVLIDGESGSGKELVARAIHRGSARRQRAFCTLNCAALPDDLVEAELFGHTRGAFTGAVTDRPGVFEEADGGTLFLDEVGELTPRAQAKVLRVVQDGELRRVGANISRRVDVRIVSATNRALRQEVEAGRFRLDLLYRLDVVHIAVPPLRERREDVALLADHFWRDATQRVGSRATLGAATIAALARYDWPGNVRELQNVLAALAVRTPRRGVVPPSALPACFGERGAAENWSLDQARRTFELSFVRAALVRTGGHRGRAAAELGVTRQGLTKLMSRLGI
jgi:DNA-binding NtrC family response regulator/tetratricopeptide (TPR) repeat protein